MVNLFIPSIDIRGNALINRQTVNIRIVPQTWVGRVIATLIVLSLIMFAFFFISVLLIAFGLFLIFALLRMIFRSSKVSRQMDGEIIEGNCREEPCTNDSVSIVGLVDRVKQ